MSDGVRLYADVRRPALGRFPALLTQTPYNKQSSDAGGLTPAFRTLAGVSELLVTHGYAQVAVDVSGTGASEGAWDSFGPREQLDSLEISRWLAPRLAPGGGPRPQRCAAEPRASSITVHNGARRPANCACAPGMGSCGMAEWGWNRWPWVLGGLFLAAGVAVLVFGGDSRSATPPEVGLALGGMGLAWLGISAGAVTLFGIRRRRADRLRERGVPGYAVVKEITDTGMTVNQQPRVKLKLEVHPEGLPPYELTKSMLWPRVAVGQLTSGARLPVKIDPANKKKILIDGGGDEQLATTLGAIARAAAGGGGSGGAQVIDARHQPELRETILRALREQGVDVAHATAARHPGTSVGSSGDPADRLAKLTELRDTGLITSAEFESQKARILADI